MANVGGKSVANYCSKRLHSALGTHNDTTINVMMLFVGGWDVHAHCCMLDCLKVKRCKAEPLDVARWFG